MSARYRANASLPRHAFDPDDQARASGIWRAFQELAVDASTAYGWPPDRYRQHMCAFVMRSMSVVHHRQVPYGETHEGETWVRRMRRGMLSTREVRLVQNETREAVASGTQEWVHVDDAMKPARGIPALIDAFPVEESETTTLPTWQAFAEGPKCESTLEFEVWNTWMDPLGHVNHPRYLDFCEEGLTRMLITSDIPVSGLIPRGESLTFFRGLVAGDRARVRSQFVGVSELGIVSQHTVERAEDGALAAQATLFRSHRSGDLGSRI